MKKLFTLLTMLIVAISTSWAADPTPGDADSKYLDITKNSTIASTLSYTYKHYDATNNVLVVLPAAVVRYGTDASTKQNWCDASEKTTQKTWTAPTSGDGAVFKGRTYYNPSANAAVCSVKGTASTPQTFSFRVSNCTEVRALVNSSNTGRTITMEVYPVSGTDYSTRGTKLGDDSSNSNSVATLKVTGMSASQVYEVFVTSNSGSESLLYELAFFAPASAPATKYTVTFNAGDHGTCATTSLTEASAGAGVTLPEVTPNSGYVFNGWYTDATEGTKVGDAGNNYKPSADNTPLYAQYSEIPTPTFVLSATSIEVGQTAQIKVTGKDDLDGVTLSDISYGTADIVTVDATTGVVTPVAAGSTTITFNSSAVAGKYKASSGNLSITVTAPKCATPTISPVSFSTDNQEVTITSETAGATIYYTTDGATPSTNSLVYDSENKPTISSTTTFKAIAVKENYDDSEVATQKITRTSSAVVASWDFTKWSSETQAGVRADGTNWRDYETSKTDKPLNDKVYSNKVANATFVYSETTIPETKGLSFATTAYTFGLAFDQSSTTIGTYHGSEYLWLYGSNSTITIPSLSAGSTIEIGLESHKINGTDDATRTLTVTNTNEGSYSTETYTEQTFTVTADGNVTITPSKGMHIYYITVTSNVETEGITTDNGVATYVTKNALDFTGLETKAYVVKSVDTKKNKVFTEEVTTVPAGTALLVKGATVNVPVIASATAPATNLLQISTGDGVQGGDNIFAYSKSAKQFKKVSSSIKVPAGKCYLQIDGISGSSLDIDLDGEATAINNVDANENANSAAPVKVIKNGKLYIGNYNVAGQLVK